MAKRGISWLERDNQTFFFVVLTHSYICLAAAAGECLSADSYLHVFFILERKKKVFYVIASNVVNYEREREKKKRWKEREFRWLAFETCNRLGSAGAVESDGPKDGNECCGEGQRRDWCVTAVTAGLPSAFPCSFIIIIIPSLPHFLLSKIGQTLQ